MTDTSASTSHNEAEKNEAYSKTPKVGIDADLAETASDVSTKLIIGDIDDASPGDDEVDPNADLVPESDLDDDVAEESVGVDNTESAIHAKVDEHVVDGIDISDQEAFIFKEYLSRAPSVAASSGGPSAAQKQELLRRARLNQQKQEEMKKRQDEDKRRGGGSDAGSISTGSSYSKRS